MRKNTLALAITLSLAATSSFANDSDPFGLGFGSDDFYTTYESFREQSDKRNDRKGRKERNEHKNKRTLRKQSSINASVEKLVSKNKEKSKKRKQKNKDIKEARRKAIESFKKDNDDEFEVKKDDDHEFEVKNDNDDHEFEVKNDNDDHELTPVTITNVATVVTFVDLTSLSAPIISQSDTPYSTTKTLANGDVVTSTFIKSAQTSTVATTITRQTTTTTTTTFSNNTSTQSANTVSTVVDQFMTPTVIENVQLVGTETIPYFKPSIYGTDEQHTGVRTVNEYLYTNETNNGSNVEIGATAAYARGWTGKGSTILIMDTGIDVDHVNFQNKIKYKWTAGYTNPDGTMDINDTYGHGTHVASIAAGARNGVGTHGVAYDADLAIARVSDHGFGGTFYARDALEWAKGKEDIVVANLSFNTNYHRTQYLPYSKNEGNGIFTNNAPYYGGGAYYNLADPQDWAAVMPSEMVLVVSAGNQNLGYVQNPATFAAAQDTNGNLVLDGRMLIAGNWNTSTQLVSGNKAGHMCKDFSAGVCNDKYRTSDFFLLAPGTNITAATNNGGFGSMSGTSMAAPAISGGVAIMHQLWPYMKGKAIAQVLLQTANKNLPGYDVNIHGQGLLDLDKATQPIGNLGISLTGRTGNTAPLTGIVRGFDLGSAISSVSSVDSLGRDFTVNLSSMSDSKSNFQSFDQLRHKKGRSWGSKFASLSEVNVGDVNVSLSSSSNLDNFSIGYDVDIASDLTANVSYSATENNPWMEFSGVWGETKSANTFDASLTQDIGKNGYLQLGAMVTTTEFDAGLVTNVDPITAAYAVAGYETSFTDKDTSTTKSFNAYGGIKPYALSGGLDLTIPTSVDENGLLGYTDVHSNLNTGLTGFVGAEYSSFTRMDDLTSVKHSLSGTVDSQGSAKIGYTMNFKF